MNIDDNEIQNLTPALLFSKDLFYSLVEIAEPEERIRLETLVEMKAKDLGLQQQFKKVMRSYTAANEELSKEYKRANAQQRCYIDLDFDGNGRPVNSIDNFLKVLENDSKFDGLKFNLLTHSPEKEKNGVTEKWSDADDAETRRYIEKRYGFHSLQKCDDALRIVFAKNQYHPIRDMVDALEWDGVERITEFLTKWTKCDDTPYTREVSRLIFSGGINRLYEPGCKFDDMPVLIGTKQGEGKSTLVRWLAMKDEYYTEVNEFEGERGMQAIEGAWICEVSELLAMTKTKETEAVKSFLARMNDRRKIPYDRRVTDHLRQCIFIGTTNKEQFLTDKTGNRRFYPVKVRQNGYELFDQKDEIQEYIRQCWAEARIKYRAGQMKPYADRSLIDVIRQNQNQAVEDDYRVGMIADYLEQKNEICILDLWQNALKMGIYGKPTKKDSNEISLIMQNFEDWEKQDRAKRFADFGVQRWWKKKEKLEFIEVEFENPDSLFD